MQEKAAMCVTVPEEWFVRILRKRIGRKMCDLEKQKLLEHGHALTDEQKAIIIQKFPMHVIANELVRRDMVKDVKIYGCEQSLHYE